MNAQACRRIMCAAILLVVFNSQFVPVGEAGAAIISTTNAKIRAFMHDGFGNTVRNHAADGMDPVLGTATLNLNAAGVNSIPLGIFPAKTAWAFNTTGLVDFGNGSISTGAMSAGFSANFFGFDLAETVTQSQFDPAGGAARIAPSRLRIDFTADFQNNADPIIAAGLPATFGWFTEFGVLFPPLVPPDVLDFAEVQLSITIFNHGGAPLSVNQKNVGDNAGGTPGFFHRSNPPLVGFFEGDIGNTIPFPEVTANALVTLQGHIDMQVDPATVILRDINPIPVPEPTTATLTLLSALLLAAVRVRRRM